MKGIETGKIDALMSEINQLWYEDVEESLISIDKAAQQLHELAWQLIEATRNEDN